MSDAGVDDGAVAPTRGLVTRHWWRATALVATVVMAAFSWHDPLVAVFADERAGDLVHLDRPRLEGAAEPRRGT